MQTYHFFDIPDCARTLLNQINDQAIKKVYSIFTYLYFPFRSIIQNDANKRNNCNYQDRSKEIEQFLINYLKDFKFLTYKISKIEGLSLFNLNSIENDNDNFHSQNYEAIICIENKCIVIDEIDFTTINGLFEELKRKDISLINYSFDSQNSKEMIDKKEEITNFCDNFQHEIKSNKFVNHTIPPVIGYLIRRYFYPTNYFTNQSFFEYGNSTDSNQKEIKNNFIKILESNDQIENSNFPLLKETVTQKNQYQIFNENDFVILRKIYSKEEALFYLVLHVESLHVFMMKKIFYTENSMKEIDHEIYFCENYSHHCLTHFYGFLKEEGKVTGFIYEYMCNGTLNSYVLSHKEKISKSFILMTINRIFQGINFIHSKSLIHRDLKPGNILIDHDNLPYISDFETLRHPNYTDDCLSNGTITNDIGSPLYSSPEQDNGELLSYPTDIYSFGLIIYFLIEKNHKFGISSNNKLIEDHWQLSNTSENLQRLYELCIKANPNERPTDNEVLSIITDEVNSFYYLEDYLMKSKVEIIDSEIISFLLENIFLVQNDSCKLNKCFQNINTFKSLLETKIQDESSFLLDLGFLYEQGNEVEQNYVKAKEYYELSAKQKNSQAIFNLGFLYEKGKGVEQSYSRAKEHYLLSAELNNSSALNSLGYFYENGYGGEKDYKKAMQYYESAAQMNNNDAFTNLGFLYEKGFGCEQDYTKAKEYYELAAEQNNPLALNNLGCLYEKGFGCEQDYTKAIYYYELAAEQNNPLALNNLGCLYEKGFGCEQDYTKAIYYYELAAEQDNPLALNNLALLYLHGNGVEKDYSKVIKYYSLSAEQNNSDALYSLGVCYEHGFILKHNISKALEYYELAAKQNHSKAFVNLGDLHYFGVGVDQNYEKAKEYYELAAKQNNCQAFINLADMYAQGQGVEKNYEKVKEYYELAAEQNNVIALIKLGDIYKKGYGTKQNEAKAKEFYELAAKQNNPVALFKLGCIYWEGFGVKKDYLKAKEYYELAAQQNNPDALFNLGNIYENGYCGEKNYQKAKEYYEQAIQHKSIQALVNLGNFYENGLGVDKDLLKAKELYELASKQNNSAALVKLGILYSNRNGVQRDFLKAKNYFELAAKLNDSNALVNLGYLYYNGYGVPRDYLRAIHLYKLAAQSNNSEALVNLGGIYEDGIYVEQNYKLAKEYYELAAEQNNSNALYQLGNLYFHGFGVKQDYLKAKKYLELSSQSHNSDALLALGIMYENGNGVEKDYLQARDYYELSAKLNNSEALFYLGNIYSTGDVFDIDITKACHYYQKCIEIHDQKIVNYNSKEKSFSSYFKYNKFFYCSCNNLGLIYLTAFNDIKKATELVKEAGLNEFPFGQNNFGLLCQFYLNKIEDAKYMFQRASQNKFALAEYNLGYLNEKEGKTEKSIEYYIKALEHANEPLIFHNDKHFDKRLEISKKFIFGFVNLKLVDFYLSKMDYEKARIHFYNCINQIHLKSYQFCFHLNMKDEKEPFLYLKSFILNFPLFNLINQPNLKSNIKDLLTELLKEKEKMDFQQPEEEEEKENDEHVLKDEKYPFDLLKQFLQDFSLSDLNNEKAKNALLKEGEIENKEEDSLPKQSKNIFVFEDELKLFDFVIENVKLKESFMKEIKCIIKVIESILYTHPYSILFGRLSLEYPKIKENDCINPSLNDINDQFYEGFGF